MPSAPLNGLGKIPGQVWQFEQNELDKIEAFIKREGERGNITGNPTVDNLIGNTGYVGINLIEKGFYYGGVVPTSAVFGLAENVGHRMYNGACDLYNYFR